MYDSEIEEQLICFALVDWWDKPLIVKKILDLHLS
jgi:hypothetical protein